MFFVSAHTAQRFKNRGWIPGVFRTLPFAFCLLLTQPVFGQSGEPRIIREKKCKVEIEGGSFRAGDVVVFETVLIAEENPEKKEKTTSKSKSTKDKKNNSQDEKNPTTPPPETAVNIDSAVKTKNALFYVRIDRKTKKRVVTWIGKIDRSMSSPCKGALGARINSRTTSQLKRKSYIADLSLEYGYSNPTFKGLNWASPLESQSLPSLNRYGLQAEVFPLPDLDSQTLTNLKALVSFFQDRSKPEGITDPGKGRNRVVQTSVQTSAAVPFYFLSDAHPSMLLFGYSYYALKSSEVGGESVFKRPILHDLTCNSAPVGLRQDFFASGILRFAFSFEFSLVASCKTDPIDQTESIFLESRQFLLGRQKSSVRPAGAIETSGKVTSPSRVASSMRFSLYPIRYLGLSFQAGYDSWKGSLSTLDQTYKVQLLSFNYTLGLHVSF